jgi:hypothetical protein
LKSPTNSFFLVSTEITGWWTTLNPIDGGSEKAGGSPAIS